MEKEKIIQKAEVLVDALPRIRQLFGKTIVIKYGGSAMKDAKLKDSVMQDVALMKYVGMSPVIVHGGGPEISATMERMGKKAAFVEGLRITDADTMDIVQMALVGKINREIVSLLTQHGGKAVGLSGHDAGLLSVDPYRYTDPETGTLVDLGYVGQVSKVRTDLLETLQQSGYIPVIAPIGVGPAGHSYNVNADSVAGALASALNAEKLILLTDVEGLRRDPDDPDSVASYFTSEEVDTALAEERLTGGMIPKVEACMNALKSGVEHVHITDGRVQHILLLELFTDKALGTTILR